MGRGLREAPPCPVRLFAVPLPWKSHEVIQYVLSWFPADPLLGDYTLAVCSSSVWQQGWEAKALALWRQLARIPGLTQQRMGLWDAGVWEESYSDVRRVCVSRIPMNGIMNIIISYEPS